MRLLMVLFLLTITTQVYAQTMGSSSGASAAVNIIDPPASDTTTRLVTTPTVVAPGLAAAGIETCLGSASGGLSLMGGGITFGSTKVDVGCTIRLLARQLYAFGLHKAALALMCQDARVAAAMEVTGSPCPAPAVQIYDTVSSIPANSSLASAGDGSEPLSLLPTNPSTTAFDEIDDSSQEAVHASVMPVQPFSPEERAWFDRASDIN
jgi:hypothetical protein